MAVSRRAPLWMALTLLAGCAQTGPTWGDHHLATTTTTTTVAVAESTTTLPDDRLFAGAESVGLQPEDTLVVITGDEIPVYPSPGADEPLLVMPKATILGTTTVLAATGPPHDGWVEVMLPMRPNGSTGWVPVEEIHLYVVSGRILVDLTQRELVYYVGGEEMLRSPVAVGTDRNPTPTGTFFVTDNVRISRATGPWGPAALGLSARSDTITEFNGGDGIIGIHGTNRPGSIGHAASLGCVRLPNEVATLLHEMVPIGTPVEIRA